MTMPENLKFKNVNTNGTWGLTSQNKGNNNNFLVNGGKNQFNIFNAGVKNNINIATHGKTTINIFNKQNSNNFKPQTNYGNTGSQLINTPARIYAGGSGNAFQLYPGAGMGCGNSIFGNGFGGGYMYPGYGCGYGCDNELSGWDKFFMLSNAVGGTGNLFGLAGGLLNGIGSALSGLFGGGGNDGKSEGGFWSNIKSAFGFGGDDKKETTTETKKTRIVESGSSDEIDDSSDGSGTGRSNATRVKNNEPSAKPNTSADNKPASTASTSTGGAATTTAAAKTASTMDYSTVNSALTAYENAVSTGKGVKEAEEKLDSEISALDNSQEIDAQLKTAENEKLEAEKAYEKLTENDDKELKDNLEKAKKDRAEKETALTEAKGALSKAEADLSIAESNLKKAPEGSDKTALESAVTKAKEAVSTAKKEVEKAEKELKDAKTEEDKAAAAINQNDGKKTEAYNKLKEAEQKCLDLKNTQAELTSRAAEFKAEKAKIDADNKTDKTNENPNQAKIKELNTKKEQLQQKLADEGKIVGQLGTAYLNAAKKSKEAPNDTDLAQKREEAIESYKTSIASYKKTQEEITQVDNKLQTLS